MSYAIRVDGRGWRAVNSKEDVGDGEFFSEERPPIPEPPVADVVTMRQARLALHQAGLLDLVETAIANMLGEAGDVARIEWEFSSSVERDSPLAQSLVAVIGLTDEQLDNLFTLASTL